MRLTPDELALLDAMAAAGDAPAPPPALPGMADGSTTIAMLIDYRRRRLARR